LEPEVVSTRAADILDADPEAWKGENQPGIPDVQRLCDAWDRLKAAQAECDSHPPPYAGPDWAAKTQAYAEARRDLNAEFERIKGGAK
jgi:hypothetical protein